LDQIPWPVPNIEIPVSPLLDKVSFPASGREPVGTPVLVERSVLVLNE